jgi:hypothetical protein
MPEEEVARQFVLGGHLAGKPPPLVAEPLQAIEAEEGDPTCPKPAASTFSRNIQMQRISERTCEVRLSAAGCQEADAC